MKIFNIFKKKEEEELSHIDQGRDRLSVSKIGEETVLKYNNVVYSRLKKGSIYTGAYWDFFLPLPCLYKKPKILMIGLGGGTIPFQIRSYFKNNIPLDVVEINENMVKLSRKFLPKRLGHTKIIIADGSEFVKRNRETYNLIFLDAYTGEHIPDVFMEETFIKDARDAMKPDGVLAINYALSLIGIVRIGQYISRLKKMFQVYTISNPLVSGNMLIICSKKMDRDEMLHTILSKFPETVDNRHVVEGYKKMELN